MILRITLIFIVLAIALLSLTPREPITIGNDKISHFIAYGVLTINIGLIYFEVRRHYLIGVILAVTYGILIELGQYFVPGRYASFLDIVANTCGVIIGILFVVLLNKQLQRLMKALRIK